MARSPITASKEGEATLAAEETLHFDDDNLRGEEQHAVSLIMSTADNFRAANALSYLFFRM